MMSSRLKGWSPSSWKRKPNTHIPEYQDSATLHAVLSRLSNYPCLVQPSEICQLRTELTKTALGKRFVLQAGDCAECFADMRAEVLCGHYQLLQEMAAPLEKVLQIPVLLIGRIAGQYAKPRSQPAETQERVQLPSYRGDIVNGIDFTAVARQPDPQRMEAAYFHSAASLNYLRSLEPNAVAHASRYYISHEALLLPYEQTQLQQDNTGNWYCGSGHFLWIGERTRHLDGAHVEFLRGVNNPIGVKVGLGMSSGELLRLIDCLNPDNELGRLSLITRFGIAEIQRLPALIQAVRDAGRAVLWFCDPMHGNGVQATNGLKTRHYDHIQEELDAFIEAHRHCGTQLHGIHLEASGQEVTECLGGPEQLLEDDLLRAYRSYCDPRLNPQQACAITARLSSQLSTIQPQIVPDELQSINLAGLLAVARPNSDQLCFIGPGFSISYRQLNRAVRRQAASFCHAGVKADERILLALNDGPELVIAFYAALATGALPVVLNPRLDSTSLKQLIEDFTPVLCVGQVEQQEVWPDHVSVNLLYPGDYLQWFQEEHADDGWDAFINKSWNAPVLIQCTSGSTGRAKGVVHSARSILAACQCFATEQLKLTSNDILYSPSKSFFGYGMGNSLFFPLFTGACGVLDPEWPSAERVISLLRQYQPTVFFAVPNLYRSLLELGLTLEDNSIRIAFSAGATLPTSLAHSWRQRFGYDLYDGIGCTELGHVFATSYPDAIRPGSIGRMLPDWKALIVDAEGNELPVGKCGVLLVKAPSMAVGYWNQPDEERINFRNGWYRTGDLFSQDSSGYLYYHGREDDRFKVNGRWVTPMEIESLVMRLFPKLNAVFVVPINDYYGETRSALILGGTQASDSLATQVNNKLNQYLERYKLPILTLILTEIPVNKNNKPDRRAMARLASTWQSTCEKEKVC
ncbi:hypothetical protein C6H64_21095 [Photorhabdus luminescens]|nr:hypothetical protein C6H64_21095 [Photorhabdus luminescens]